MTASPDSQPARPPDGRSAPRRILWLLVLLVVLGHWLVLAAIPSNAPAEPAITPLNPSMLVFNTRRIEVPPAQWLQVAHATQAAPVQPKPVLIQKSKVSPPQAAVAELAEPLMAPVTLAEATPELQPIELEPESAPPLPAEPAAHPQVAPEITDSAAAPSEPAALPAANLTVPGSVRLNYNLTGLASGLNYHASGLMIWQQDGNHYEASMVVSAFLLGSRALESRGSISDDGLAPTLFADKGRNERTATFEADKGTISFSANTPEAPWKRGAQDRLSVFFQLASLLAGQANRFPPGSKIPIYTVGPRDVDTWTFTVAGEEALDLPIGTVSAVKLTRDPRREQDQRVEAWFAPSLGYWPVRMKITQHGGDYIDQQLSSSGLP
ncbi:MAG: hypothetical protein ACI9LD_000063 [Polaromonas sp.]|jgi:hypothetical protein